MDIRHSITPFAQTNFRNQSKTFGIKQPDRLAHMYVIGKTGTGKSTLLETLIRNDMKGESGLALLDPHGDLTEKVLASLAPEKKDRVIHFDVPDLDGVIAFNPLQGVPLRRRALAASGLVEAFKKIWSDSWGPRLEHILRNALLALLDQPQSSLADILRLLDDRDFRRLTAANVCNPQVRDFWLREYESYPARFRAEAIAPIQNKVGAFLASPMIHRILTSERNPINLRKIIDEGKILLVNLAKGRIGEDMAALFGSLLVSSLGLAGLSRADQPEESRRDFYLYLDEFHTFTTLSLASLLPELRKYHVGLVLAHQHLSQLDLQVRDAILGNAGTIISFRLGLGDAEVLEKEFYPVFSAHDLINLPNFHIYLKLMIDGVVSRPFSAVTILPFQ